MKARLGFATALEINPDILLVDEILAVGDLSFRKKSFDAFLKFKDANKTILYTTHSIDTLPQLCDRVILLDKGRMIMIGKPNEVIQKYKENMALKSG
jgi:ABC-type polysaccharide/polyol phosphate transport system ATPase subunit